MTPLADVLSNSEKEELSQHENTIHKGLATWYAVGEALLSIRDKRLYRAGYRTFEEYCQRRFGMSRPSAYRLIDSSQTHQNLAELYSIEDTHESQMRPLNPLSHEEQRIVWDVVQKTAPGKVTAAHVRSIVEVFKTVSQTGAIDRGDGEDIPVTHASFDHIKAAVLEETYERMQRQSVHIAGKPLQPHQGRIADNQATLNEVTFPLEAWVLYPDGTRQAIKIIRGVFEAL